MLLVQMYYVYTWLGHCLNNNLKCVFEVAGVGCGKGEMGVQFLFWSIKQMLKGGTLICQFFCQTDIQAVHQTDSHSAILFAFLPNIASLPAYQSATLVD